MHRLLISLALPLLSSPAWAVCPPGSYVVNDSGSTAIPGVAGAYTTIPAAIAAVPGIGTVCVEASSTGVSANCPKGTRSGSATITGGLSVTILADEEGICLQASPGTPSPAALAFDGAGSSEVLGFARITNHSTTGCTAITESAIFVKDSTVVFDGSTTASGSINSKTRVACLGSGTALYAIEGANITSDFMLYEESNYGVWLENPGGTAPGPQLDANYSQIDDNTTIGLRVEHDAQVHFARGQFGFNGKIFQAFDNTDVIFEDTGFLYNQFLNCAPHRMGVRPEETCGAGAFNGARVTLHNTLWHSNKDGLYDPVSGYFLIGEASLIDAYDTSYVEIQNATIDSNDYWWLVRANDYAGISIYDAILSDDTGARRSGGVAGGVVWNSSYTPPLGTPPGLTYLDEVAYWNLDPSSRFVSFPPSRVGPWYTNDPLFVTVAAGSPTLCGGPTRPYYLASSGPSSPYIDMSSWTSTSVGLDGVYQTSDPVCTEAWGGPSTDSGQLDLGWHWWAVP